MSQRRFLSGRGGLVRSFTLVAAAALAVLALAACGSSSSNNSTSSTGGSGSSGATGAASSSSSKAPIKLMFNSPETSSIAGEVFPMDSQVAKAYVATVNAQGGVDGHKIDVIYCDDKSDPNQTAACARQAVQNHVIADVGFTYNGDDLVPTLEKAGIPWIPTTAGSNSENTLSNSFPVTASYQATVGNGLVTAANCNKPQMLSAQFAGAAFILQLTQVGTKSGGKPNLITKANYTTYPATTTDFAPIVAAAMAKHPDCLVLPVDEPSAIGIANALRQANQHVKIIGDAGTTVTANVIKQAGAATVNGAWLVNPVSDYNSSAWADYRAAVAKYANTKLDYNGIQPQASWLAMQVATEVAAQIPGQMTASSMMAQLNKSSAVSLGSKAPPINFTKEFSLKGFNRYFVHDLWFQQVQNGKIVPAYNNKAFDVAPAFAGQMITLQ